MCSAFEKPCENRRKVFSIGINLFLGWEMGQPLNHWLCGGLLFFCAFFFLSSVWLSSLLQFLPWKISLYLRQLQEANSKQVIVLFNQNFYLQLVLSWVIEVCFNQFRSWCLLALLFGSGGNLEFCYISFPSSFIFVV